MEIDDRVEAALSFNRSLAAGRLTEAAIELCEAFERSGERLREPSALPDDLDIAVAINLGEICRKFDRNKEATAFFEAAYSFALRLGRQGRSRAALVTAYRVRAALEVGDMRKANRVANDFDHTLIGRLCSPLSEDLVEWEADQHWILSSESGALEAIGELYHALALLLLATGSIPASLGAINRARGHLRRAKPGVALDVTSNKLDIAEATAILQTGDVAAARPLPLFAEGASRLPPAAEMQRKLLAARLAILAGQLGEAIDIIKSLGELVERDSTALQLCSWYLRVAILLIHLNQIERARELLQVVAVASPDANESLQWKLDYLNRLADLRTAGSQIGGAAPLSPISQPAAPAAKIRLLPTTRLATVPKLLGLAAYDLEAELAEWSGHIRILADEGRMPEARRLLEGCRMRFQTVESPLMHARFAMMEVIVDAKSNLLTADVHAVLGGLVASFRQLGAKLDELQCLRLGQIVAEAQSPASTARITELILETGEDLGPDVRAVANMDKVTPQDVVLNQQLTAVVGTQKHGRSTLLGRILNRDGDVTRHVRTIYRRARQERIYGKGRRTSLARDVFQEALRGLFRKRRSLVVVVLPNATIIVRRKGTIVEWRLIDITATDLTALVQAWQDANRRWGDLRRYGGYLGRDMQLVRLAAETNLLHDASDRLVKVLALKEEFMIGGELAFESDGPLTNLPISALRYEDRYLVETVTVVHRVTCALPSKPHAPGKQGLAVSIAQGLSVQAKQGSTRHFSSLPATVQESDTAYEWFGRRKLNCRRVNDVNNPMEARKSALLRAIGESSHVHFAGHSTFDPSSADFSGLLLPDADTHGTILSINDLQALANVPQYAALTSCFSADSVGLPGRPPEGIARSLLSIGVVHVLASFWEVLDTVAAPFIKCYYQNCDHDGYAGALAKAQRRAIEQRLGIPDFDATSHPYCWAAYTVHERTSVDVW